MRQGDFVRGERNLWLGKIQWRWIEHELELRSEDGCWRYLYIKMEILASIISFLDKTCYFVCSFVSKLLFMYNMHNRTRITGH